MSRTDAALAADIAAEAGRLLTGLRGRGLPPDELRRAGDAQSNELILRRLASERPDDAVLSEESADTKERLSADRVWIVDPLDGTREFAMEGRTDWAVHVALWEVGKGLTAGAVAQPALGEVYKTDQPAAANGSTRSRPLLLVSDSRAPSFAPAVAAAVGAELAPMGSAGAKAMAVVRGDADAYLHAGGQWEWDSAAPVAVVLAAGLHASRIDGSALEYNHAHPYLPDLLICRAELARPLLDAIAACEPAG